MIVLESSYGENEIYIYIYTHISMLGMKNEIVEECNHGLEEAEVGCRELEDRRGPF